MWSVSDVFVGTRRETFRLGRQGKRDSRPAVRGFRNRAIREKGYDLKMTTKNRSFGHGAMAKALRLVLGSELLFLTSYDVSWAQAQQPEWRGNVAVGVSWQGGAVTSKGVDFSGSATHVDTDAWSHAIEGSYVYSTYEASGVTQLAADTQLFQYLLERALTSRVFVAVRPAFKRNKILAVDHRVEGLFGLGIRVVNRDRARINIVPIAGYVNQQKNLTAVDGNSPTYGVLESVNLQINPVWSVSQDTLFLGNSVDSDDYRTLLRASVVGVIAGPLSAKFSYTFDHENLVFGSGNNADQRMSFGLQVNF